MIKNLGSKTPTISPSAYVDDSAVIIGDVHLEEDVSIWPTAVLRGDIHSIHIGARSNIQDGTVIHVTHAGDFNSEGHPTVVGKDVIVGHRVVLHGCTVEDRVLVGMGAIIMDGVVIASNTIIGAGSLVPPGKHLASGLWVGSPARKLRELSEEEMKFLTYSASYYVELKDKYLNIL